MENSYFVYSHENSLLEIEKFHNCIWEFSNTTLIEFGFELASSSLVEKDTLSLTLAVPWSSAKCKIEDLYGRLKDTDNSRFIFNDTVSGTDSIDSNSSDLGVVHKFNNRTALCILPAKLDGREKGKIKIDLDLSTYNKHGFNGLEPNIYFRFSITPELSRISVRKNGIAKSTIIYDIKINERRNLPKVLLTELRNKSLCKIKQCFCFNILPNSYDIVFFASGSLKSVRSLEYQSFNKYLGDSRIKKDELLVVFNKKENLRDDEGFSFSFFSIYAKERIGVAQFSMAILLNVFCGILFLIASIRTPPQPNMGFGFVITVLPMEVYVAGILMVAALVYFSFPSFKALFKR